MINEKPPQYTTGLTSFSLYLFTVLFQTCFIICVCLIVNYNTQMMSKYRLRFTQNYQSNSRNPVDLHTGELNYNTIKGSEYFVPI
jgi:hypothetical protein